MKMVSLYGERLVGAVTTVLVLAALGTDLWWCVTYMGLEIFMQCSQFNPALQRQHSLCDLDKTTPGLEYVLTRMTPKLCVVMRVLQAPAS